MLRLTRLVLALLVIALPLSGQESACAHESETAEHSVPAHHDSAGHDAETPVDPPPTPCDESAAQCCDALASCATSGVPAGALKQTQSPAPDAAVAPAVDFSAANAPLEVATPPPRG